MPFTVAEAANIPNGTYPATLEKVSDGGTGQFGAMRKWHWLVEVDGRIESVSSLSSANTGPNSKSYTILKALLNRDLVAGESIEDPTGSRILIRFEKNEKGYPTAKDFMPYVEPQQTLPGVPR